MYICSDPVALGIGAPRGASKPCPRETDDSTRPDTSLPIGAEPDRAPGAAADAAVPEVVLVLAAGGLITAPARTVEVLVEVLETVPAVVLGRMFGFVPYATEAAAALNGMGRVESIRRGDYTGAAGLRSARGRRQ